MKPATLLGVALVAAGTLSQGAFADQICPRTIAHSPAPHEDWPESANWFGSRALAVILNPDGRWSTTREGARLAVKVFWYVSDFKPRMEQQFTLRIERLDEGVNDAVAYGPNNAILEDDVSTIITGIDFPSEGCWRITGELREQSLKFVVETVASESRQAGAAASPLPAGSLL